MIIAKKSITFYNKGVADDITIMLYVIIWFDLLPIRSIYNKFFRLNIFDAQ
jgi:hypothetical protein